LQANLGADDTDDDIVGHPGRPALPLDGERDGRTGLLRHADAGALADAVCHLAAARSCAALAGNAVDAVRSRTWEASLRRLAAGYEAAIERPARAGRIEASAVSM
jgi:hypothetical protein